MKRSTINVKNAPILASTDPRIRWVVPVGFFATVLVLALVSLKDGGMFASFFATRVLGGAR